MCGLEYEPGGGRCRERGCALAFGGCRLHHCPRCGYETPDESGSVLARWVRRLLDRGPAAAKPRATLADLGPGCEATVTAIDGDAGLVARLTGQGLTPGTVVRLVQRVPSYVFEVGETTLAVERSVAEGIRIR